MVDPVTFGGTTIESFHAQRGLMTARLADSAAVICSSEPFHWNGSELVISSTEAQPWPALSRPRSGAPLEVRLEIVLRAGACELQFNGGGFTDRVVGVAPEHRERLVQYLGPDAGHAAADQAMRGAHTHRLFITPEF